MHSTSRLWAAGALALLAQPLFAAPGAHDKTAALTAYGRLPLRFERNVGQTDPRVTFVGRADRHAILLSPTEAVLKLSRSRHADGGAGSPVIETAALRMRLLGARRGATGSLSSSVPGTVNYLIGNDPSLWRTGLELYARAVFSGVYPGIDVTYYGSSGRLEYDFHVAPGADPSAIRLAFDGAKRISVAQNGDLVVNMRDGAVRWGKPVAYQVVRGRRVPVAAAFAAEGGRTARFRLARYDRAHPLVIDPILRYSTYVGGGNADQALDIALDQARCAYITGATSSPNYPTTLGVFQPAFMGGPIDAFVTKLDPFGRALVYSTFLGSQNQEIGFSIDVDKNGAAAVTGWTDSPAFPITANAYDPFFNGQIDVFVSVLLPDGSNLAYSTYLGGNLREEGREIRWGPEQTLYVTGFTTSPNYPVTLGCFDPVYNGNVDAFFTKLAIPLQAGGGLLYSTFIGSENNDHGLAMAVSPPGDAYIGGSTDSAGFPTSQNPVQPVKRPKLDAFALQLRPLGLGGADLLYSTFLGGDEDDECYGVALEPRQDGMVQMNITGYTQSPNFPLVLPAFQPGLRGARDAFVSKIRPANLGFADLIASTYLGGADKDEGNDIAVDDHQPYVVGSTQSVDFPVTPLAIQPALQGPSDAFVTRLAAGLNLLIYSTYLGGEAGEAGFGISLDGDASAYVCGQTGSLAFPVTAGAFQVLPAGAGDAFVTKLGIGRGTDLLVANAAGRVGDTVNLKAKLIYSFDGSVIAGKSIDFYVDGVSAGSAPTDAAGWASVAYVIPEGAGAGNRTISAVWVGDASAEGSSGTNTLAVSKSGTTIYVPSRTGTITENVRLKGYLYRVSDGAGVASRSLTFKIDGTTVGSANTDATGYAYVDWVITAGAASRTITVEFAGDTCYNASSGTATLTCQTWSTHLYLPARSGVIADVVYLKAYLYKGATGADPVPGKEIIFKIDGTEVGRGTTNAWARAQYIYTIPEGSGAGTRAILADWVGDGGYRSSTGSEVLTVNKAPVYIFPYARSVRQGYTGTLKAYVRRLWDYVILVGKTISFTVDGTGVGSGVTDGTGWAQTTFDTTGYSIGSHPFTADFAGDAWYRVGTSSGSINIIAP